MHPPASHLQEDAAINNQRISDSAQRISWVSAPYLCMDSVSPGPGTSFAEALEERVHVLVAAAFVSGGLIFHIHGVIRPGHGAHGAHAAGELGKEANDE